MLRGLSVNQLLFITHLLLVVILVTGFSVTRYQSEWNTRLDNEVALAEQIVAPLVFEMEESGQHSFFLQRLSNTQRQAAPQSVLLTRLHYLVGYSTHSDNA